jgi:hypothetical protein
MIIDPTIATTAISTIVSLISSFKAGRDSLSASNYNDFTKWLNENNHSELFELLQNNTKTTIGIKALLSENNEVLLTKLNNIDNLLASLVSNINGFSEIVNEIKPQSIISGQAINILQQFEEKKASKLLKSQGGDFYQFMDGGGAKLIVEDLRFIEDDFYILVELGLLRYEVNHQGYNLYILTRNGSSFVTDIISKEQ